MEELIGPQALSADLQIAIVACLSGAESRRWTVGELFERLKNLGLHCSKPALLAALGELELEIALCQFPPWSLVEQGTEWSLAPKSQLLALLSGVRKLPRAFLRFPHRRGQGGALGGDRLPAQGWGSKTRIGNILKRDPSRTRIFFGKESWFTPPGARTLSWRRPTPEALLALGPRSCSDIPSSRRSSATLIPRSRFKTMQQKKPTSTPF